MILNLIHKNLLQVKNAKKRMVFSTIFIYVTIIFVGLKNGAGARVSAKVMNDFVYVLSMSGALDLLMNNLAYEKRERTLDIMLAVVKKRWKIVFAEGISTVILAIPFLVSGQLIFAAFNCYFETVRQQQGFFVIETSIISWIKIMVLVYIFSICTIIAMEWLHDEKTSIFLALVLALGACAFVFLFSSEFLQVIISFGIAFLLTIVAAKLLTQYMEL